MQLLGSNAPVPRLPFTRAQLLNMATLTTLELLSPPADVMREAQSLIAMALQQDASNQPGLMAAAFTTSFTTQPAGFSAGSAQPSFSASSGPASASYGTGGTLSDGLADPQVAKRAHEEIRALADSIRSARDSFETVQSVVYEIDQNLPVAELFQPTPGKDFPEYNALSSKWSDIREVCVGDFWQLQS